MNNRNKKNLYKVVLFTLLVVFSFTVSANGTTESANFMGLNQGADTRVAKYVFLFIGDGMATPQINAAESYANARESDEVAIQHLRFAKFPVIGLTTTYDAGSLITDSASAGTALASGNKTLSGTINMSVDKSKSYKLISEYAKEQGKKIGIVSSVSIDHATPACFYSKVPSRGNMYDIAIQLTQSDFDYFGGGGFAQPTGKKKDQKDVITIAKEAGYTYVNSPSEFNALTQGVGKVIAINERLQDSAAMPYDLDRKASELSLADYTQKVLSFSVMILMDFS